MSDQAPQVVLVTGVSRYLGAQAAARLAADPRIDRVIGVDLQEPSGELATVLADTVEFVRADIVAAQLASILVRHDVRTLVHLAVVSAPDQYQGGRPAMKEQNVIGSLQLLAAAQQAPTLRRLIVRSSTAAYGRSFRDPAVFTEETAPRDLPRGGFARDVLDIEGYVRGFRRRRPDVEATVLRFAPFIGRRADTSLTRYFSLPVVPTVLGRDPRLQFVHVDDAMEILHRAVLERHPGTFNVAGAGTITLSQAVRRAGRISAPVPEDGMSLAAVFARRSGLLDFNFDQLDLFVHGRVVDSSKLIKEFRYEPRSTAEAFADFLRGMRGSRLLPREAVAAGEALLLDQIRGVRARLRGDGGAS
jgi:UDP-glucose 4-epimerase